MKEIAPNIYIEQNSLGLFTGLIQSESGCILIDSPLRSNGGGLWKGPVDPDDSCRQCYMIVLDTNYDRLLSIKGSDCVIVAHADAISPIRNRTPRPSDDIQQHGENPEASGSGSRMLPPEIVFDTELSLYLGDLQIILEHHTGSNQAGTWVVIPDRKVVFVGDTVVVDQPPFLAYANLKSWEADLELLSSDRFIDYLIVSSRSSLVDREQVNAMRKQIENIRVTFDLLKERNAPIEDWYGNIPQFLARFSQLDLFNSELFYNRLHWGITTYYEFNCREKG